jgi:2',3'-cyclic-nucleotide 2'-phosphodiesterase (5'-nucleotidase family)
MHLGYSRAQPRHYAMPVYSKRLTQFLVRNLYHLHSKYDYTILGQYVGLWARRCLSTISTISYLGTSSRAALGATQLLAYDGHTWLACWASSRVSIVVIDGLELTCLRPSFSADWGDYVSFAIRMKETADERGVDVVLVDTGDRVEGSGLYDASHPKGKYTYDIVKQQDIDVICSGNHELYKANTAEREYNQTVPNFKGNYLASNIDILDPKSGERIPLAARYRKFTTKNQKLRVLAFGFLYNFNGNANNIFVQKVEDTIEEKWFQEAIRDRDLDLVLVTGHVALRDDITGREYTNIFRAIRQVRWDIPIQFIGGHTHIRDYRKYDSKAHGIESGRYMETIGFMSIDGVKTKPKFDRRYIDNNLFSFLHHTELNESTFPTEAGQNVSKSIRHDRKALDLGKVYGCAPQHYWVNRAQYPGNDSLFTWLEKDVLGSLVTSKRPSMVLINTGAIRFDIFQGPFTKDSTFSVSPFTGGFKILKDVPTEAASRVLELINNAKKVLEQSDPCLSGIYLAPPQQLGVPKDIVPEMSFESSQSQTPFQKPHLVPGYTTKDDAGEDGDDTLHSPVSFYRVPNCIQTNVGISEPEPETVDMIFLDFIQPWILQALLISGREYTPADAKTYMNGTSMIQLLVEWIGENWAKAC